jgi:hypothetical protein
MRVTDALDFPIGNLAITGESIIRAILRGN